MADLSWGLWMMLIGMGTVFALLLALMVVLILIAVRLFMVMIVVMILRKDCAAGHQRQDAGACKISEHAVLLVAVGKGPGRRELARPETHWPASAEAIAEALWRIMAT